MVERGPFGSRTRRGDPMVMRMAVKGFRVLLPAVALSLVAFLIAATGAPAASRTSYYDTFLLSRAGDASSSKGSDSTPPNCVAFVSRASNLVPGDTNGKADAFVYWIATGKVQRVSVSSTGRQSNGDTYDVAVDGTCERIAFTSDATN